MAWKPKGAGGLRIQRVQQSEPLITGETFSVILNCMFTGENVDDHDVVLILDGEQYGSAKKVQNNVAQFELRDLALRTHFATINILETEVSRQVTISAPKVPIKTTPEVTSITAVKSGANGNYLMTITVMTNKGPAKHCQVQVTDRSPKGSDVSDFMTDEHGTYKHRVQVKESERFLTYKVLGGDGYVVLEEKTTKPMRLFGPRSK